MSVSQQPVIVWAGLALPDAHAPVTTDFGVLVRGGRIEATGPRAELTRRYPEADVSGGDGLLLLPAFVNSHDHGRGLGTASLGVADDLLEIWLKGLGGLPSIPPLLLAQYEGLQLLRSGVSALAHSHNPASWTGMADELPDTIRGYQQAGVRVALHPPLVDQNALVYAEAESFVAGLPSMLAEAVQPFLAPHPLSHDAYFEMLDDLYERYHDAVDHRLHVQVSPAGGQWCSDELILRAVEFARQRSTRVQMHMLETAYQRHYAHKTWGKSFVRHLEDIDALGNWLTLAHMVHLDGGDFVPLVENDVSVVHNPSSNLRLRSGIAPVAALLGAGVRIAVGLDGHGLDDDQDYLRELRLAWTLANRPGAESASVAARTVLEMGTTAGAAATFGAGVPLGKLEPGYLADLVLVDWRDGVCGPWTPPHLPEPDYVPDFLLRRAVKAHVHSVMVGGEWRLRAGQHTSLDEHEIAGAIRESLADQPPQRPDSRLLAALAPYLRRFYASWDA